MHRLDKGKQVKLSILGTENIGIVCNLKTLLENRRWAGGKLACILFWQTQNTGHPVTSYL